LEVLISTVVPDFFFGFLETVSLLQPCSIEQIRSKMKSIWGPVRAAKAFAMKYNFVATDPKSKYVLTTLGERLLKYTNNARVDFLILNVKLQEQEPFLFLKNELTRSRSLTKRQLGELLQVKFRPNEKWSIEEKDRIGDVYAKWLIYLRQGVEEGDLINYVGGIIRTFEVLVIPEMRNLLDRNLYDWLTEKFHTPHNLLDEPYEMLKKVETTNDPDKQGEIFESFVASCFRRLGFTPRLRDGLRERKTKLTYERKGGGDIGLFCHFPTVATDKVHQGYAIACEAKAAQYPIGSKAVGQARNLCEKIKEAFSDYLVHTVIVSRSTFGYDSSAKEQASPEVMHLNHKILLGLLDWQKKRLEKGLPLITPTHFMMIFKELIQERNLEPTLDEFMWKIDSLA